MIKILFMDVDGTLTDGTINMGENGEVFKSFNVKDGYGIKNLLQKKQIIPAVITGRKSSIVENRCKELGIVDVVQNADNKVDVCDVILNKYGFSADEAAYIGDDLNDREVMLHVAVKGCPADAAEEIIRISNFVATVNGGQGAVREFIEWIIEKNNFFD